MKTVKLEIGFILLALLMCCGVMRPAHAVTITYVSTPCVGCTTQAQLDTAATNFLFSWLNRTPTGYVGIVASPPDPGLCTQGAKGTTTLVVTSPSMSSTYFGCYRYTTHGYTTVAARLTTSTNSCYFATYVVLAPCVSGGTNNTNYRGTPKPGAPIPTFPNTPWGTTTASIEANFAYNIMLDAEHNANLNTAITTIGPVMLARLSTEMARLDAGGYTHWFLAYAVGKVSAANMQRLHTAFGDTAMNAVVAYMPAAVRAAYVAVAPLPYSQMQIITKGGFAIPVAKNAGYAYDLLLLQHLSAGDPVAVSLHKTTVYIQVHNLLRIALALLAATADVITIYDHSTDLADWYYFWSNKNPDLPTGGFGQKLTGLPDPYPGPPIVIPDPGLPDFPPIDNPPPDSCFSEYDGDFCG
jgi:hypothetical protein